MMRAPDLDGRAVVDVDAAEKLGTVDRVILDPEARRVAGFVVSRSSRLFAKDGSVTLPASAVVAVGPDALMIDREAAAAVDVARLETLPYASEVVGRKVVTRHGRLLGTVEDVLIDTEDGHIVGYTLADANALAKLEQLIAGARTDRPTRYVRADADLRAGHDLIVAPDDAVSDDGTPDSVGPAAPSEPAPIPRSRWGLNGPRPSAS